MVRSSSERTTSFYAGCALWIGFCWWLVYKDLGSIAFVGSVVIAIWIFGLRDKFEGESTPSAYSVFNNGGKAILGSLTGEQIDQQMRGGGYINNKNESSSSSRSSSITGPLTTVFSSTPKKLSENDKLKRRAAAASAAERRLLEHKETENSKK